MSKPQSQPRLGAGVTGGKVGVTGAKVGVASASPAVTRSEGCALATETVDRSSTER